MVKTSWKFQKLPFQLYSIQSNFETIERQKQKFLIQTIVGLTTFSAFTYRPELPRPPTDFLLPPSFPCFRLGSSSNITTMTPWTLNLQQAINLLYGY
jgi:hypothetical protein